MKRRDFVSMIGGAAVGWPLAIQAQQRDRLLRLGVLMGRANNPISQTLTAAFLQGLGGLLSFSKLPPKKRDLPAMSLMITGITVPPAGTLVGYPPRLQFGRDGAEQHRPLRSLGDDLAVTLPELC